MHRPHRMAAVALAGALALSGCYGPFNLTRRLYQWNGQVGAKWEREFMFVVLAWAQVYSLTGLGDAVVFNSMEFWTGKNPVDPPGKGHSGLPRTTHLARGDAEAFLTYSETPEGPELLIKQFQAGRPAGSVRLHVRDGHAIGVDDDGAVMLMAQSSPTGEVIVTDDRGRRMASPAMSRWRVAAK